ncbi:ATP-binding protein [Chloroflexota bacterium]
MIISVASGKGGTGKTLVATSLAFSLKERGEVRFLDCDVEEPNDHIFMHPVITDCRGVFISVPVVDEEKCNYCGRCAEVCAYHAMAVLEEHVLAFHQLCHGCGACAHLCPRQAITEVDKEIGVIEEGQADGIAFAQGRLNIGEAMAPPIIRKVKEKVVDSGIVICDSPPGTSCPVVETLKGSDFCLLVTEPTPFGMNDLVLAMETVKELGIPCGVVINRAGLGDGQVEDYCRQENIPVLLTIPLDTDIARLYSRGVTLVKGMPQWRGKFAAIIDEVAEIINERNHNP